MHRQLASSPDEVIKGCEQIDPCSGYVFQRFRVLRYRFPAFQGNMAGETAACFAFGGA